MRSNRSMADYIPKVAIVQILTVVQICDNLFQLQFQALASASISFAGSGDFSGGVGVLKKRMKDQTFLEKNSCRLIMSSLTVYFAGYMYSFHYNWGVVMGP